MNMKKMAILHILYYIVWSRYPSISSTKLHNKNILPNENSNTPAATP